MNAIIGFPFVSHVDQNLRPQIENPKEFLQKAYVRFFTNNINLLRFGNYKVAGYSYNFKPLLKKYVYKQYGQWSEAYAPNKTLLRKATYGHIDKIIEIN
jgi:hypothetical protein